MRPDVTTRECNSLGERVGTVTPNQTEPIGPPTPNKQSKLLLVVGMVMRRQRGTRERNVKRHLSVTL
jgi:hypothetical protein